MGDKKSDGGGKDLDPRPLSSSSSASVWEEAVRDTIQLRGRFKRERKPAAPPPGHSRRFSVQRAEEADISPVSPPPESGAHGLDRRSREKLRKGELPIDRVLDLHGLREGEAHALLKKILLHGYGAGERLILVITGKGQGPGGGLLKRRLPLWCAEAPLRAVILGTAPARPVHGGEGATYVLLRRRRSVS